VEIAFACTPQKASAGVLTYPPYGAWQACYIRNLAAETFQLVSSKGHTWLQCAPLAEIPWLIHAFGTRRGGAIGPKPARQGAAVGAGGGKPATKQTSWRFLQALGLDGFPLAMLRQTHSAIVYCVSPGAGKAPLKYQLAGNPVADTKPQPRAHSGDALIASHSGMLLGIRVADCVPVLLVDRERRAVAVVHAGWRGALNRIAEKTAGEMCRMFNSRPQNLLVAIGPSIRKCCYEVGPEVVDDFCGAFPTGEDFFQRVAATREEMRMALRYQTLFTLQAPPGHQAEGPLSKVYLDLVAVARYQLEQAGIPPAQIYAADYCTACRMDLFYSYRKEGAVAGRMMAVIGMRSS
jgi:purine-nucleoside/S-methyl-5'-thioadenosine phosphorylase / adenosine deaminase